MRGEHVLALAHGWAHLLQPPHARGTHERRHRSARVRPSTPACAGNTAAQQWVWLGLLFNPRMRGEHVLTSVGGYLYIFNPRMRGEHASVQLIDLTGYYEEIFIVFSSNKTPSKSTIARSGRLK